MIVIGGDLAGLAAAFYARRSGREATVFDPAPALGGHARTMEHGAFRFDTGFHWLHEHAAGRDAADPALDEMRALLGEDLRRVSATMQIAHGGRLFDFPIDTLTLARRHGARGVVRTGSELAFQRARAVFDREPVLNFEEWVTSRYGRSIAKPFFIDYAEKLFGRPAARLSPASVRRIDDRTATRRYPARGIGQIAEALAASCGPANVHTRAQITQIHCSPRAVTAVEVDGVTRPIADTLVSTLPVPLLLKLMRPVPPVSVTNAASRLRFRDLRLVTLMLSRARVTAGAAVFFPEPRFPFTRVSEPRNRSELLAPAGCTSLVAEVPCSSEDAFDPDADRALSKEVIRAFEDLGWIREREVIDAVSTRVRYAYPVVEVGLDAALAQVYGWLAQFRNLRMLGRTGRFEHTEIQDLIREGRAAVEAANAAAPDRVHTARWTPLPVMC